MSKHTPGPWFVVRDELDEEDRPCISTAQDGGPYWIAECIFNAGGFGPTDPIEANARLIAAAPDLLEVAELFKAELDLCMVMTGPLADKVSDLSAKVNAAIAKAKGESRT